LIVETIADKDNKLALKSDSTSVYTRADTNTELDKKANVSALADGLATKADLSALTDGLATKANVSGLYTTTQVDDLLRTNDCYLVEAPLEKQLLDDPCKAGT
jgi:hypothetical protein